MNRTLEDMRWARDNGACGVLKKGDKEAGWWPAEEDFFPMYEEAEKLGLTICFHIGGGLPDFTPARRFSHVGFMQLNAPLMNAFHSLISHNVPALFPRLRFAFVENGASWLPYCIYKLRRTKERRRQSEAIGGPDYDLGTDVLRDNRFYVTCQVDEDVPYLLRCAGQDNLMVGSDYAHSDPSQEGDFVARLREFGIWHKPPADGGSVGCHFPRSMPAQREGSLQPAHLGHAGELLKRDRRWTLA